MQDDETQDYTPENAEDVKDPFEGERPDEPAKEIGIPAEELGRQLDGMANEEDSGDDTVTFSEEALESDDTQDAEPDEENRNAV